jgi:hypothetical protein
MTQLLSKAVREIEQLPAEAQDSLATVILEQVLSDDNWAKVFAEQQTTSEVFV